MAEQISVSPEAKAAIAKYAEAKGVSMVEAANRFFSVAISRLNALSKYAKKMKGEKPAKAPKAKKEKVAKAPKAAKAAKAAPAKKTVGRKAKALKTEAPAQAVSA